MGRRKMWQARGISRRRAEDGPREGLPRLPRGILTAVWIGWLAIAIVAIGIFAAAIPLRAADLRATCAAGADCAVITATLVALDTFSALVWLVMAVVIFWRRPGDRVGLFTSLTLLTFGLARFPDMPLALGVAYPDWGLLIEALRFLGSVCLSLFFYVFPDGRFVPRATRWVALAWIAIQVPEFFLPGVGVNPDQWSPVIRFAGFLGYVVSVTAAQTYRYRRVSTPAQREQTRWVMLGITVALTLYLFMAFGYPLVASLGGAPIALAPVVARSSTTLALLLVPVSLGIAILRRRLYDVDTLINRALVYGSLTALLSVVYLCTMVGAQAAIGIITGERELPPPVIVLSTLMIAMLFQPLRQQLQRVIDHRFYRRKYDAARTVETFATTLRGDIDLADLSERLVAVVEQTMQPTHVWLWLRERTLSPGAAPERSASEADEPGA